MTITGKLLQSTPVEQITDSFRKSNVILQTEYDTQYPQEVCIEVHNENIDKLKSAGVKAGDVVNIEVNLRGRKYEKAGQPDRWFNTLVLWKISKTSEGSAPEYAPPVDLNTAPVEDDLPFN